MPFGLIDCILLKYENYKADNKDLSNVSAVGSR